MDIAALNTRITFQKNTVTVDAIGNHLNGWTDYYACAATISDSLGKSSAEETAAGQTVDTSDISFTVRWCAAAAAVDSLGYRILWNGEVYNILKVDHLNLKRRALKFKCEKGRR